MHGLTVQVVNGDWPIFTRLQAAALLGVWLRIASGGKPPDQSYSHATRQPDARAPSVNLLAVRLPPTHNHEPLFLRQSCNSWVARQTKQENISQFLGPKLAQFLSKTFPKKSFTKLS